MIPLWPQYYADCQAIFYVLDSSCPSDIGPNCIQLLHLLSHEDVRHTREVLIVLNKAQTRGPLPIDDLVDALLLDELRRSFPENGLKVVRCDSVTGDGLSDLRDWLDLKTHNL